MTLTRSRRTAIVLAVTLGWLGGQRFYVGRNLSGMVYFYASFSGIPLVLGLIDAIRWARMTDRAFSFRYGFAMPHPTTLETSRARLRRRTVWAIWHVWKATQMVSWLLAICIAATLRGSAETILTALGSVIGCVTIARLIGDRIPRSPLRLWIDPIGAEGDGRVRQPVRSPVVEAIVVALEVATREPPRRRRRRRVVIVPPSDPWARGDRFGPSLDELPVMNPATGLLMSGPGAMGVDGAGNPYGLSHESDHQQWAHEEDRWHREEDHHRQEHDHHWPSHDDHRWGD